MILEVVDNFSDLPDEQRFFIAKYLTNPGPSLLRYWTDMLPFHTKNRMPAAILFDGLPIAWAAAFHHYEMPNVYSLGVYVSPWHRRLGHGKAVMSALLHQKLQGETCRYSKHAESFYGRFAGPRFTAGNF